MGKGWRVMSDKMIDCIKITLLCLASFFVFTIVGYNAGFHEGQKTFEKKLSNCVYDAMNAH